MRRIKAREPPLARALLSPAHDPGFFLSEAGRDRRPASLPAPSRFIRDPL
ncbi:MAG: hypothetical protein LLH30_05190 [Candidatus Manganitrophus sp. SA1]|nr:hypothetical protein [Candidatus Manganitrophus morganii]